LYSVLNKELSITRGCHRKKINKELFSDGTYKLGGDQEVALCGKLGEIRR